MYGPGSQRFSCSMLTTVGEIVWVNSRGKERAPSYRFSQEVQQCLFLPQNIDWRSTFCHRKCKEDSFRSEEKSLLLISVAQRPQTWTYNAASTTSQSEAHWRKAPAISVLENDFPVWRYRASHALDTKKSYFDLGETTKRSTDLRPTGAYLSPNLCQGILRAISALNSGTVLTQRIASKYKGLLVIAWADEKWL